MDIINGETNKCSKCKHYKVCKYVEDYKTTENTISQILNKDLLNIFSLELKCNMIASNISYKS